MPKVKLFASKVNDFQILPVFLRLHSGFIIDVAGRVPNPLLIKESISNVQLCLKQTLWKQPSWYAQ